MVAIYPRQSDMNMSGMSGMAGMSGMTGMTMTTTGTAADSSSTSTTTTTTTTSGSKLSPAVIAILAVIGGIVISIFIGFWLHSKIQDNKRKKNGINPGSGQQLASTSLSVSTYVGATSVASTMVANSTPKMGHAGPPFPDELGKKAANAPMVARDPEVRWMTQEKPGGAQKEMTSNPEPLLAPQRFGGHPYLAVSMPSQESVRNIPTASQPITGRDRSPQPSDLSSAYIGSPPDQLHPQMPSTSTFHRHNDSTSSASHDPTTGLLSAHAETPPQRLSPRPLPQPPSRPSTQQGQTPSRPGSSNKPDTSFLMFDDGASDSHIPIEAQEVQPLQPGRSAVRGAPVGVRLMNVTTAYEPELPDELELRKGDVVRLLKDFDDGWCVVEYLHQPGKRPGTVPRMCLEERIS